MIHSHSIIRGNVRAATQIEEKLAILWLDPWLSLAIGGVRMNPDGTETIIRVTSVHWLLEVQKGAKLIDDKMGDKSTLRSMVSDPKTLGPKFLLLYPECFASFRREIRLSEISAIHRYKQSTKCS